MAKSYPTRVEKSFSSLLTSLGKEGFLSDPIITGALGELRTALCTDGFQLATVGPEENSVSVLMVSMASETDAQRLCAFFDGSNTHVRTLTRSGRAYVLISDAPLTREAAAEALKEYKESVSV